MGLLSKIDNVVRAGDDKVEKLQRGGDSHLSKRPPSIIDHLNDVLDAERERKNFFRPSMLHGCKRQNVFHYMDAERSPQQMPNQLQLILDNGTAAHGIIQKYLQNHPDIWFVPEGKIDAEIEGARVRGSSDGVLIRRSDLYRWGLELKTIKSDLFKLLRPLDNWEDVYKLKQTQVALDLIERVEGHVDQASIYCVLMKLQWITLLYWNKDSQALKEFPVQFSAERWEKLKKRIKFLKSFVDKQTLPKFDPAECDPVFCGFTRVCRKNGAPI